VHSWKNTFDAVTEKNPSMNSFDLQFLEV